MKTLQCLLRFLKLYAAFFFLFAGLLMAWFSIHREAQYIQVNDVVFIAACLAFGTTIFFMEFKKD
jgi:hypothetical protein